MSAKWQKLARAARPKCAAQIPEPGQWNLANPVLRACKYVAAEGSEFCPVHLKKLGRALGQTCDAAERKAIIRKVRNGR